LRHTRLRCHAERVDFSGAVPADLAGDGPDAALHARSDRHRSLAAAGWLLVNQLAAGALLLRLVSRDRLGVRLLRVYARAPRALEPAVVVVSSAILLPPSHVLRDDQIDSDGDSRASRRLGETGTQGHRRSRTVTSAVDVSQKTAL